MQRSPILYLRNTTTVDTGGGANVRYLNHSNGGAVVDGATITATHTQDGLLCTWNPAFNATPGNDPATMVKLGWGVLLTEMDPGDPNCVVRIVPQTVRLWLDIRGERSGAVPVQNATGWFLRCSLWRYNVVTDTGVQIAQADSATDTWGFIANTTITKNDVEVDFVIASEATFAADEILMLQCGMTTGTLGNPLAAGTVTYVFTILIDQASATRMQTLTQGMRRKCTKAVAGAADLSGIYSRRLTMKRARSASLALDATFGKRLTAHRTLSAALTLAGIYDRVLVLGRIFAASMTLTGAGNRRLIARRTLTGTLDMDAAYDSRLTMFRSFTTTVTLAAAYSRKLALHRLATAALTLDAAYDRALMFRRAFTTGIGLTAQRVARRIIPAPKTGALDLTGHRRPWTIRLGRADLKATLEMDAAFAKTLQKQAVGQMTMTGAYSRRVTIRRAFVTSIALNARMFVKISQDILNRIVAGGSTAVRKIWGLYD